MAMDPQMIKQVNIPIDKLQKNKPCSLSKQGLLLYHGFRHLLSFVTPSLPFWESRSWAS